MAKVFDRVAIDSWLEITIVAEPVQVLFMFL